MHLFVDNLTNIDFSYLHPTRGLLGETWLASTLLDGNLDQQGMVCDFGVVKKTMRNWLDEQIDHRLLVPRYSPQLTLKELSNQIELNWRYGEQQLHCVCPKSAIALVESDVITAGSTAEWSVQKLQTELPATLNKLQLEFSTEEINGDFYHYSHGLKKHNGNCQRIAHGHRSRIRISRNNQPAPDLEAAWANHFKDIYIGTREDITNESESQYHFGYTTSQGSFELSLPKSSCYLLDSDTTVEWIATHIADALKNSYPTDTFFVKAFEGMGKGAIVTR